MPVVISIGYIFHRLYLKELVYLLLYFYTEEENVQVFDWPGETFERVREEAVKRQQDAAAIVAIPGAFAILVSLVCFLLVNKKK